MMQFSAAEPKILLFLCFILHYNYFFAQNVIEKISITQFGAVANDKKSDHKAFNKAAEYINTKKGNIRLIITAGEYTVGVKPVALANHFGKSSINDVLQLTNCNNVTIEGTGKVLIKFENALPFGKVLKLEKDKDSSVHIGNLFRFTNCTDIRILNIAADGNKDRFLLLKTWGLGIAAYEREHDGLFILNCRGITIKNSVFKNFGRDGLQILQNADGIPVEALDFSYCIFNNNGRNGVSWCGGKNVRFYNCIFNENGRGKITTNPASGLDIEPERTALCKNGSIIKCSFVNNAGYAVVSGIADASNVIFDSCIITGNTNYALLCNSPRFTFKNTRIYGTVLLTYDAAVEKDGMNFLKCTLSDSIPKTKIFAFGYLVAITGRYAKFESCTFTTFKKPVLYTEIKRSNTLDDTENSLFNNCVFNVYFKKASTWGANAFLVSYSNFNNCTFKSAGFANFKRILNDAEKYTKHKNSTFIGN